MIGKKVYDLGQKISKSIWKPILLSLATATLMFFTFPHPSISFLAWIALVPMMFIMDKNRVWYSVGFSMLAGFLSNIAVFYWIFIAIYSTASILAATLGLFFLCLYVALYTTGVWALLLSTVGKNMSPVRYALFSSAIWVSMEFLRGQFMSSFPWAYLGYSQWNILPVIQISEITTALGVSFLIVFFNNGLYFAIKERIWKPLIFASIAVAVVCIYGFVRLNVSSFGLDPSRTIKVASIQGNIPQHKKWNRHFVPEIQKTFEELIAEAVEKKVDLIVWPETAVPGIYPERKELKLWVEKVVKDSKTHHLIGMPFRDKSLKSGYLYNSSFLLGLDGNVLAKHDKISLVIMGEFVPFRRIFPGLSALNVLGDVTPGRKPTLIPFKDMKIAATICSESYYCNLVRKFIKNGGEIIINQTNDAWFWKSPAAFEHFTMDVFRAVENRKMMLSSGNTGMTGVIAPSGKILQTVAMFTKTIFVTELTPSTQKTFYTLFGDVFAWLCSLIVLVLTFLYVRKNRHYVVVYALQKKVELKKWMYID